MSSDHEDWYSEGDETYLDLGLNYRFELGRASGGIGMAMWDSMAKIRSLFDAFENVQDIEYSVPRFTRKSLWSVIDDATGKALVKGKSKGEAQKSMAPGRSLAPAGFDETLDGGPFLAIDPPWYVKLKPSKSYPDGRKPISKVSLFTWTSKMSCPSFSMPGGPIKQGGSCQASLRKSVVGADDYERDSDGTTMHERIPENTKFLCDFCYTGKNNYLMYKQVSVGQTVHLHWINRELDRIGWRELAIKMASAVASLQDPKVAQVLMRKLVSNQYFRVHDSGDLHRPDYYLMWREVCAQLPEVRFWCPTRQWVFQKWRDLFRDNPPPDNLALRPSALFFGAKPPTVEGMEAAGTTAADSVAGQWENIGGVEVWNCPAYAADEHSCASAINPDNEQGCRTCWVHKDKFVNYKAH